MTLHDFLVPTYVQMLTSTNKAETVTRLQFGVPIAFAKPGGSESRSTW